MLIHAGQSSVFNRLGRDDDIMQKYGFTLGYLFPLSPNISLSRSAFDFIYLLVQLEYPLASRKTK